MNKVGFLFLGAVMSMGSLLFVQTGCGDDSAAGGSGGSGGTGSSTSSSKAASSTATSTTTSSSGGSVKLDCDSYCGLIATSCKDAAVAQWPSAESCKAACASLTPGTLADMAGDTLGCRLYHAGAASKDAAAAAAHCPHAGPTGGDLDPTATGMGNDGPCGDGVEAFCKIAQATCKDANKVWDTEAACVTAMKGTAKIATAYSTADTAKKDFGCFFYHLTVAATDATSAATHCKHINPAAAAADAKCTM